MVSYTELTVLSTIQFTRFLKEKTNWGRKKKCGDIVPDKQKSSLNRHLLTIPEEREKADSA